MKKLGAKKKGLLGRASDPASQSPVINGTKKSQIKGILRLRANLKALSSSPSTSLAMGELQDWIAQYPPPKVGVTIKKRSTLPQPETLVEDIANILFQSIDITLEKTGLLDRWLLLMLGLDAQQLMFELVDPHPPTQESLKNKGAKEITHALLAKKHITEQCDEGAIDRYLSDVMKLACDDMAWQRWLFSCVDAQFKRCAQKLNLPWEGLGVLTIRVPEPNPYANEFHEGHYLKLSVILRAIEDGYLTLDQLRASKANKQSESAQIGWYLFCSVLFSGVCRRKQLFQIAQVSIGKSHLDEPLSSIFVHKEWPLAALKKISDKNVAEEDLPRPLAQDRWIADPVSAIIHQRYRSSWKDVQMSPDRSWKSIEAFLMGLLTQLQEPGHCPKLSQLEREKIAQAISHFSSLKRLLIASEGFQIRSLPSYIWNYLAGNFQTTGLQPESLLRLAAVIRSGDETPHFESPSPLESAPRDDVSEEYAHGEEVGAHSQWVYKTLEELRKLKKLEHISALVIDQVRSNLDELDIQYEVSQYPLTRMLGAWTRHLLETLAGGRNELNSTRMMSYVQTLSQLLLEQYELEQDLCDFTATERKEELDDLLKLVPSASKRKIVRRAWHQLHQFLIAKGDIAAEDYDNKSRNLGSDTDAEYISEPEFQVIARHLYYQTCHGKEAIEKNVCLMVLTLAYRLGLRRSEVIQLGTSHVVLAGGTIATHLVVQRWNLRRLKTPSSTRVIPLKGLLLDQERGWLSDMARSRQSSNLFSGNLLEPTAKEVHDHFFGPHVKSSGIDEQPDGLSKSDRDNLNSLFVYEVGTLMPNVERIVDLIHLAMRAVTGRETVRFHHLRHSCATNTLLLLAAPELSHSWPFLLDVMYGGIQSIENQGLDLSKWQMNDYSQRAVQIKDFQARSRELRLQLFNDPRVSYSQLYLVSRLLGHSSPVTTLQSYIHVIDLLAGAYVHERIFELPQGLVINLYPDTARNYQKRKNLCSIEGALNQAPAVGETTEQDVELSTLNEQRKAHRKPKLKTNLPPSSLLEFVHKHPKGIACLYQLLKRHRGDRETFSHYLQLHGWSPELAQDAITRAQNLTATCALDQPKRAAFTQRTGLSNLTNEAADPIGEVEVQDRKPGEIVNGIYLPKPILIRGNQLQVKDWSLIICKWIAANPKEAAWLLKDYVAHRMKLEVNQLRIKKKVAIDGRSPSSVIEQYKTLFALLGIKYEESPLGLELIKLGNKSEKIEWAILRYTLYFAAMLC
jgi:integrase